MANDRLYLVCDGCGALQIMAKYYPMAGPGTPGWEMYDFMVAPLRAFLVEHSYHHPANGSMDMKGFPGFHLVTESSPLVRQIDVEGTPTMVIQTPVTPPGRYPGG